MIFQDDAGAYTQTPFSDDLASAGTLPGQAVNKIRMVEAIGWPKAADSYKDRQGKALLVKKDDQIWLLKCKPTCWRLYFYVTKKETENRLIYLHAVCKKTNKEDPQDLQTARSRMSRPGGRITPLELTPE